MSSNLYKSGLLNFDAEFDPNELQKQARITLNLIDEKLPLITPRCTSNSAEIQRIRMDIIISCREINAIVNGILGFDPEINITKKNIVDISEMFSGLFHNLGIPFNITVDFSTIQPPLPSPSATQKNEIFEAKEKLSSIQDKIASIQDDLNEFSLPKK